MILGWSLFLKTEFHGILAHNCEQLFTVCSSLAHVGAEFGKLCKIDADVAHEKVLVCRWQVMAEKTTGEMVVVLLLLLVITATTTNNPIFFDLHVGQSAPVAHTVLSQGHAGVLQGSNYKTGLPLGD